MMVLRLNQYLLMESRLENSIFTKENLLQDF